MSLAEVLAWKFDHAPGIRTRVAKGKAEIFDWPPELGPAPTQAQIDRWTDEFNARPPADSRFETEAQAIENASSWAMAAPIIAELIRKL